MNYHPEHRGRKHDCTLPSRIPTPSLFSDHGLPAVGIIHGTVATLFIPSAVTVASESHLVFFAKRVSGSQWDHKEPGLTASQFLHYLHGKQHLMTLDLFSPVLETPCGEDQDVTRSHSLSLRPLTTLHLLPICACFHRSNAKREKPNDYTTGGI